MRDIVRGLRVSATTVIDVRKKQALAGQQVKARLLHTLDPEHVDVILRTAHHLCCTFYSDA